MMSICHSPYQSNSSYRILFGIIICLFLLLPNNSLAAKLSGIYSSACEREIGIILNVDDTKVRILNLDGEIKSIRRFDIIYIAQYPIGNITIPKLEVSESVHIINIRTLYKNKVVDLVKGWMTNYSDTKISFLTTDGIETVIDTNDIWDISFEEQESTIEFNGNGSSKKLYFVHPYPFASCEDDDEGVSALKIYPDHLLEIPLLIKTELDRMQAGYEELQNYAKKKKFYPKPQIYTNTSMLSVWASAGLRYGSSDTRSSNFIPAVRNEMSEGPFKFQRVIVTGSAPMPYSIHEEPQTQFYYSMKSSYFHMSLMYDIMRIITNDYNWQFEDLHDFDDRQNEKFHLGGGFDYGNYAIEASWGELNYAVRHKGLFQSDSFNLYRFGFFYTHRFMKASIYVGSGAENEEENEDLVPPDGASQEEIDYYDYMNKKNYKPPVDLSYRFYRLNLDFQIFKTLNPQYSIIYKKITFEREPDLDGGGSFMYEGESLTNALYFKYEFMDDLFLNGFVSLEKFKNKSNITQPTDNPNKDYYKSGISLGLVF